MAEAMVHAAEPARGLTARQRYLLSLVVQAYIEHGRPIGSQWLVETYHLPYSPATVRNELAVLTAAGYLSQPHPSAGRVPTPQGYRVAVQEMLPRAALSPEERAAIRRAFQEAEYDSSRWLPLAARLLARQAQAAAIVTGPDAPQARVSHVALVPVRGRQVLLVVVLEGGEVRQRLLLLPQSLSRRDLVALTERLTQRTQGRDGEAIARLTAATPAERLLLQVIADEVQEAARRSVGARVYRAGLHYLLQKDPDSPAAQAFARWVEEGFRILEDLFGPTSDEPPGRVHILIGAAERGQEFQHCAIIWGRYGRQVGGLVSVVGPLRIPYQRAIPAVGFMAQLLTELMDRAEGATESAA